MTIFKVRKKTRKQWNNWFWTHKI